MIWNLFTFVFIAISPVLTAVVKEKNICSANEFSCNDGACVSLDHMCDGILNCADGSDEMVCFRPTSNDLLSSDTVLSRSRRQTRAPSCRKNQWRCRNGECISFDGKCDGVIDCTDGSDETHPLCRKTPCQRNWFKCTYGACVDGTAPCNGVQDCADNSDELLPRCRNETDEIKGQFRCLNGDMISAANHCDGVADCADGSDETVRACAGKTCPSNLFQCAYGACVDQGSDCNNEKECIDGSDESDELCNRISSVTTTTTIRTILKPGDCILPAYPEHGGYLVGGVPNAAPGQSFETIQLNVTCNPGYGVMGKTNLICINGFWSDEFPQCVRFCKVKKHPSVEYHCLISGGSAQGTRDCNDQEPSGTVIQPECRAPNYYHPGVLNFMRCIDGMWDSVAICTPVCGLQPILDLYLYNTRIECGRVTAEGEQLIIDGRSAKYGELPWHVGIYRKTVEPYMQICGGSIVSNSIVISAAHCFWSDVEQKLPASRFAVAAGKIYRPWNNPKDFGAQKSDVQDIRIPSRFQGSAANYQEDIAIVILTKPFEYKPYLRPACLDFDINFDRSQLQHGKLGKVAGWGLTSVNGNASQILKVAEIPYVSIDECIATSPAGFREFITSDKICAGYRNGTALCKGDSGGGLVFPSTDRGIERYYLRGIVSTAPNNDDLCNAFTLTSFTQITKHEPFIKAYF